MQNNSVVSTIVPSSVISNNVSSNNSSTGVTLLQAYLKTRGYDDEIGSQIYLADEKQNGQEQQLNFAIDAYLEDPTDPGQRSRALQELRAARQIARDNYNYARKQQAHYQQLITAESAQPKTRTWGQFLFGWIDTNQDQVEKYQEEATKQQKLIQEFSEYIGVLEKEETLSASETQENKETVTPVLGQFPAEVQLATLKNGAGIQITGRTADLSTGLGLSGTEGVKVFPDGSPGILVESKDAQSNLHVFLTKLPKQSPFSLDTINGTNGVRFDGEGAGQVPADLGGAVTAGNVLPGNGPALVVGAYNNNNGKGRTYIVPPQAYANKTSVPLTDSSITYLDGENPADLSGVTVTVGDITASGQPKVIVSADNYPGKGFGRVYAATAGKSLSLGDPSFPKFDGDSTKTDYAGLSTSVGDINGDKKPDLVVTGLSGATTEVVYGGDWVGKATQPIPLPTIGDQGHGTVINLPAGTGPVSVTTGDFNGDGIRDVSILRPGIDVTSVLGSTNLSKSIDGTKVDGNNGFKVTGITGVGTSHSAGAFTDVNGDGYEDLIFGSPNQNSDGSGETFVVFGKKTPIGTNGQIAVSELNGTNGFKIHGRAPAYKSGSVVSRLGDLNGDGVPDFGVSSPGGNQVDVIFGDTTLKLTANNFNIYLNQDTVVTPGMLAAVSENHPDTDVIFTVSGTLSGIRFMRGNTTTTSFSQAEVKAGAISIRQDGSTTPPQISVGVETSGLNYVPATQSSVALSSRPVVTKNSLELKQGDTVLVTPQNITATQPGNNNTKLTFTVSDQQHGQFLVDSKPASQFTNGDLVDNVVEFEQDDQPGAPYYTLTVKSSDGSVSDPSEPQVTFESKPQLTKPSVQVSGSSQTLISPENFAASDPDAKVNASQLGYQVSNLKNSRFLVDGEEKTNFTHQDVLDSKVVYDVRGDYNWFGDEPGFDLTVRKPDGFECKGCPVEADVGIQQGGLLSSLPKYFQYGLGGAGLAALAALLYCGAKKPNNAVYSAANALKSQFYYLCCYCFCRFDRCSPGYVKASREIVSGIVVSIPENKEYKDEAILQSSSVDQADNPPLAQVGASRLEDVWNSPTMLAKSGLCSQSPQERFITILEQSSTEVLKPNLQKISDSSNCWNKLANCFGRLFSSSPKNLTLEGQAQDIRSKVVTKFNQGREGHSHITLALKQ